MSNDISCKLQTYSLAIDNANYMVRHYEAKNDFKTADEYLTRAQKLIVERDKLSALEEEL